MNLFKEFREDTIENVLEKHGMTLEEAFNHCLHSKVEDDVSKEELVE